MLIRRALCAAVVTGLLALGATAPASAKARLKPHPRIHVGTVYDHDPNWAGYTEPGSFTEAAGSFVVPSLTLVPTLDPAHCANVTEIFVGVMNRGGKKLRAGVDLSGWSPVLGSCRNPNGSVIGNYSVWAWYANGTTVTQQPLALSVYGGDTVGVTLTQADANTWDLSVTDQSATYALRHPRVKHHLTAAELALPFSGPATVAQSIVGAPSLARPCGGQCVTAAYSQPWGVGDASVPTNFASQAITGPAVDFGGLSVNNQSPSNAKATKYTQYEGGGALNTLVSMPSQPLQDGFWAWYVLPGMLGAHGSCLGTGSGVNSAGQVEPCLALPSSAVAR